MQNRANIVKDNGFFRQKCDTGAKLRIRYPYPDYSVSAAGAAPAWLIIGVFHPSLFFAATPSPGEDEKDGPKVVFFPFSVQRGMGVIPFPALSAAPLLASMHSGGVGHFHQPLLGNELSGRFADAVRLVLDAYERHFEVADKFHLMGSQTTAFLFGKSCSALLQHLERRRCVFRIVVGGMGDRGAQQLVVRARVLKLFSG